MDPVTQIAQKILAERARQLPPVHPPLEADPPPYTPSDDDNDSDSDSDSDVDGPSCPLKVTINAAHSIRGSNNLVPTSPAPLADATKFSTLLLHSINQINNAQSKSRRALRVDLTINCGITVIGDRNVVGAVGLKPKGGSLTNVIEGAVPDLRASAVVGAKRKAEEDLDEEPAVKKTAVKPPVLERMSCECRLCLCEGRSRILERMVVGNRMVALLLLQDYHEASELHWGGLFFNASEDGVGRMYAIQMIIKVSN